MKQGSMSSWRCLGVDSTNGLRCQTLGKYKDYICSSHLDQRIWNTRVSRRERRSHGREARCSGYTLKKYLCRNRVAAGPFAHCHLHKAHCPPVALLKIARDFLAGIRALPEGQGAIWEEMMGYAIERAKWEGEQMTWGQGSSHSRWKREEEEYRREKEKQRRRERAEQEEERRRKEERREEERARQEKEERREYKERRREEQARQEEKARREKRHQENGQRSKDQRHWRFPDYPFSYSWTSTSPPYDALTPYMERLVTFRHAEFTPVTPISFSSLPWPVLKDPKLITESDITFATIDEFFEKARRQWNRAVYRSLVRECQRVLHPDRWDSRKLGNSIADAALRESMKRCFVVASQVVNSQLQVV
ncbi:hypothetical protein C8J56DRAFT_1026216 [Mycena floridula]|nr:hypothetical protein C8J56DRAFT_1026216 [Mycena floridula]